jgi:hypothetical protein
VRRCRHRLGVGPRATADSNSAARFLLHGTGRRPQLVDPDDDIVDALGLVARRLGRVDGARAEVVPNGSVSPLIVPAERAAGATPRHRVTRRPGVRNCEGAERRLSDGPSASAAWGRMRVSGCVSGPASAPSTGGSWARSARADSALSGPRLLMMVRSPAITSDEPPLRLMPRPESKPDVRPVPARSSSATSQGRRHEDCRVCPISARSDFGSLPTDRLARGGASPRDRSRDEAPSRRRQAHAYADLRGRARHPRDRRPGAMSGRGQNAQPVGGSHTGRLGDLRSPTTVRAV